MKLRIITERLEQNLILLLNGTDQFLNNRIESLGGGADKKHNPDAKYILEQIEKFEGILIATTIY